MLKTWVLLALIAGASFDPGPPPAQQIKDTGPGGVSCTYEKCMSNCTKLGGRVCSTYCEATVKERRAKGICK